MKTNRVALQITFIITSILYVFLQTNLLFASHFVAWEEYLLIFKNIFLSLNVMLLGYFSISLRWTKKQAHLSLLLVLPLMMVLPIIMVINNFIGIYSHWTDLSLSYLAIVDFLSYLSYRRGAIYITLFFLLCYLVKLLLFKNDNILRKSKSTKLTMLIVLILLVLSISVLSIIVLVYDYQYISYHGIYNRSDFYFSLEEPSIVTILFLITSFFIGLVCNFFNLTAKLKKILTGNRKIIFYLMTLLLNIVIYFTSQLLFYSHSAISLSFLMIAFFILLNLITVETAWTKRANWINAVFNTSLIMMATGIAFVYAIDFTRDYRGTLLISIITYIFSHWWSTLLWTVGQLLLIYFFCYLLKKIIIYSFVKIAIRWQLIIVKEQTKGALYVIL